jgi:hypothetical protein
MLRRLARLRSRAHVRRARRRRRASLLRGEQPPPTPAELLRACRRGIVLEREALNFVPGAGCSVGSTKGCCVFRDNPGVVLLFALARATREGRLRWETMQNELDTVQQMARQGCPTPLIFSDVFFCVVDGHRTFGYLCENVRTSMLQPYKPQSHAETMPNIKGRLIALPTAQLARARRDVATIGEYTRSVAFVHDCQVLLKDWGAFAERGSVVVIDPGPLRPPRGSQMRRLLAFCDRELGRRAREAAEGCLGRGTRRPPRGGSAPSDGGRASPEPLAFPERAPSPVPRSPSPPLRPGLDAPDDAGPARARRRGSRGAGGGASRRFTGRLFGGGALAVPSKRKVATL